MNPQLTNIALMLGLMQVAKRIPFDDPNTLNLVRIGYVLSNVIILGLYYYISTVVKRKNDLTTLKYTESPSPFSGETTGKLVTTTVRSYDESQLKQAYRSVFMGIGMMCVMHFYFKYTNPLVMQSVLPLKSVFESKLVQVHIFDKPAVGDLLRPWKASAGPFGMFGGEPKGDKKSVESAERKGSGGAKEE